MWGSSANFGLDIPAGTWHTHSSKCPSSAIGNSWGWTSVHQSSQLIVTHSWPDTLPGPIRAAKISQPSAAMSSPLVRQGRNAACWAHCSPGAGRVQPQLSLQGRGFPTHSSQGLGGCLGCGQDEVFGVAHKWALGQVRRRKSKAELLRFLP